MCFRGENPECTRETYFVCLREREREKKEEKKRGGIIGACA